MTKLTLKTSLKLAAATLALGAMTAPATFAAPAASNSTKVSAQSYTKVASNNRREGIRSNRTNSRDRVERRTRNNNVRTTNRSNTVRRDNVRGNTTRRNTVRQASYRGNNRNSARYYSPYRSNIGISFSFGNAGYSPYRWAKSPYSLYRPGRLSYASYSGATRCNRVILDGWHRGRIAPISVQQCYNPYDGSYIIQGTERLVRPGY